MKIYKCIFTGTEVVCDNDRPFPIVDDCVYAIQGRYVEIGGEDYGLGANVDDEAAEGATADTLDNGKQKVVDVVHFNRLVETCYDKKAYMAHIKAYLKAVNEKIKAVDEEASAKFMSNAQVFIKKVIADFGEYQFFLPPLSDDANPEESIVILGRWEGETPTYYFWKDGLHGQRV